MTKSLSTYPRVESRYARLGLERGSFLQLAAQVFTIEDIEANKTLCGFIDQAVHNLAVRSEMISVRGVLRRPNATLHNLIVQQLISPKFIKYLIKGTGLNIIQKNSIEAKSNSIVSKPLSKVTMDDLAVFVTGIDKTQLGLELLVFRAAQQKIAAQEKKPSPLTQNAGARLTDLPRLQPAPTHAHHHG